MAQKAIITLLAFLVGQPAFGQTDYACFGVLPAWSVSITGDTSVLTTDKDITMDVMDETRAEGDRHWPRALTLVGRNDTAIVVLEKEMCELNGRAYPLQSQVLTQYGTVPILLTGCCELTE